MAAPDITQVVAYLEAALGAPLSWPQADVATALAAETAAQARRCRTPVDPAPPGDPIPYPDDLAEALFRRVAHNLAVRPLTLGVQPTVTESAAIATFVGGTDAEVRRLEAPHRRLVIG